MKVRLQKRDKMLFTYLLRYKVANLYQMQNHLNIPCQRHTLLERLNQLVRAGYLYSTYFNRKKVYGLGIKGQDWLYKQALIVKKFKRGYLGLTDNKLTHDVLLNDVTHKLETVRSVTSVVTHNEQILQPDNSDNSHKIPDALFVVSIGKNQYRVALELEISMKSQSRYLAIMDTYLHNPQVDVVLYLVPSKAVKRALEKMAEKFTKFYEDKIYFGFIDPFLKNPKECIFVSSTNRSITLTDFSEISGRNLSKRTSDSTSDTTPDIMSEVI